MAIDLLLRFLRDLSDAAGELEFRGLRLEAKRHADLDRAERAAAGSEKRVLGPAERLLPEEGFPGHRLEFGSHQQEAVLDCRRRAYLERRGRRLSATTTRLPAAVAVPGGSAGRPGERTLHRVDRSRDGV